MTQAQTAQKAAHAVKSPAVKADKAPAKKTPQVAAPAVTEAFTYKASIAPTASAADVRKFIDSVQRRGKQLDIDMHSAAMACLHHADKHGDITLMERLLLAMPKGSRRNAMLAWALAYGPFLRADADAQKAREGAILVYFKRAADFAAADSNPFWDFKNVREGGDTWVYEDYIANVLRNLKRHADTDPKAKAAIDALSAIGEAVEAGAATVH